jgi:hypothetical protein
VLLCDGPNILWAFAKAREITDNVGQQLEETSLRCPNSELVRGLIWQWKEAK